MLWGVQWYLWALLLILAVLAVFLWRKALKAGKERRERLKKEAEIWKKDFELRQEFAELTDAQLSTVPNGRLLHGVAMHLQIALEKETDMKGAFLRLPLPAQYLYALEYFDEDAQKSLSGFYKNNGEPLTGLIPAALDAIGYTELLPLVEKMWPMYDEESEASIDYPEVTRLNDAFRDVYDTYRLLTLAAEYIRSHKDALL